jgi:hypothetical protein
MKSLAVNNRQALIITKNKESSVYSATQGCSFCHILYLQHFLVGFTIMVDRINDLNSRNKDR